jgi:hypothetical protein
MFVYRLRFKHGRLPLKRANFFTAKQTYILQAPPLIFLKRSMMFCVYFRMFRIVNGVR